MQTTCPCSPNYVEGKLACVFACVVSNNVRIHESTDKWGDIERVIRPFITYFVMWKNLLNSIVKESNNLFSTNTNDLKHLWLVGFADQRSCEELVSLEQPRLSMWSLFKYKETTSVNLPAERRKNTWRRTSFRGSFVSSWSKKHLFTFYQWVSINTTAAHRWLREQNATICTYSVFHLLGFIWELHMTVMTCWEQLETRPRS